ncbi:hypothetical protein RKD18_003241 [Streptomyces phaeoluteigriseus]
MWPSVASGSLYGSRTHAVKGFAALADKGPVTLAVNGYVAFLLAALRISGNYCGEHPGKAIPISGILFAITRSVGASGRCRASPYT